MPSYHDALLTTLTEAGELIMRHRDSYELAENKDSNEIVTPADIAANELIINKLKTIYPAIPVYSEEGGEKSQDRTRWIVDPLDGTTPWVWGNSGFSISIALETDGTVIVGAVYDPVMHEFFYAEKGFGATKNGHSLSPTTPKINDAFMVVDWGNSPDKRQEGLAYFNKFLLPDMFARRVVPQFAPALGLCRIAEGRIHALVCNDTWVEDHAAGALILAEAGGYRTNFYNHDTFNHRQSGIIATNNLATHQAITKLLTT